MGNGSAQPCSSRWVGHERREARRRLPLGWSVRTVEQDPLVISYGSVGRTGVANLHQAMIPAVLFATAFLVRVAVGSAFAGPAYPDSYYYVDVARQLAAGHGLTVNYLWNLDDIGGPLAASAHLPVTANGLWMPLAEFVQVPFIWLIGPTALAAGLPFWILGALAAPLTYWIGRDMGISRSTAATAGLLVAVPAGLTPFVAQPDNFALAMVLGPLSLWLCVRGAAGQQRAFVAGGLVVGLATLARLDGILLAIPFVLVALRDILPGRARVIGWPAVLGCAAMFALVMGPWLYRQWDVFGSLSPSAASGRMLWLTDYQQLFSFASPPTPDGWLAQGFGTLAMSRIGGLLAALGLFGLLPLAVVLAPFAAIGAWVRRRDAAFRPFFVYAAALFAVTALFFPVLVPHGTFLHASAALVPHTFLLVVVGIAAAVPWVAQRRPRWDAGRATRVFTYATFVVALIAAAVQTVGATGNWSAVRGVQEILAVPVRQAAPQDRFMAVDPGAINYLTGHQGVVTPADPLPVIEAVMRAYDVRWLILERASIVPALAPVLTGEVRPTWLSAPVATVVADDVPISINSPGTPSLPAGATYAVCFAVDDARCQR